MTALAVRTQDPRATMMGVSFHCQRLPCLGGTPLTEVRKQLTEQNLHFEQATTLPSVHFSLPLCCLVGMMVDRANAGESFDPFNSVKINRGDRKTDDTLIRRDVDASLTFKDPREPSKIQIVHTHILTPISAHNE